VAVTLDVPPGVLSRARDAWDDAHDQLSGSVSRLDGVAPAKLSATVPAAVAPFLEVWSGEVAVLSRQASANALAFVDLDGDLGASDTAEAARLRSLLPWTYHAAPIQES